MLIQQILMRIFVAYENERTYSAAFHILTGKRSGTTIQDVGLYKLFPYFGILKKFPRKEFDRLIEQLQQQQFIVVDHEGYFTVSEAGKALAQQPFDLFLDGWHYRGNEHTFFARLALIVQTLSHQAAGQKTFVPIVRDEHVQHFVRRFFVHHQFQQQSLQQPLREELLKCFEGLDEQRLDIFTRRLHGAYVYGYTWSQIADEQGVDPLTCQLYFISILHEILVQIEQQQLPLLTQLAFEVKIKNVLTDSAKLTADLYMQGRTMEEIAAIRRLKMSTIEDHMVEFAMYEPSFNIESFVSAEDCAKVSAAINDYMTKKLKVIKQAVPHLSYFQLKLALAKEGTV